MNQGTNSEIFQWAEKQWGQARLGDRCRTLRAVKLGAQLAAQPAASLLAQTCGWKEAKAAYRLLNEADVTHAGCLKGIVMRRGFALALNQGLCFLFMMGVNWITHTIRKPAAWDASTRRIGNAS